MERKKFKPDQQEGFKGDSSVIQTQLSCTKESLRLYLTIMASNRWTCNSVDIKSAFLQGKEIGTSQMLQGTSITHADDFCWGGTKNLKKIN